MVETSRQESIRPSLLVGILGATHGRPEAARKHAEGTRTFDQGAAEAVGQAEGVNWKIVRYELAPAEEYRDMNWYRKESVD